MLKPEAAAPDGVVVDGSQDEPEMQGISTELELQNYKSAFEQEFTRNSTEASRTYTSAKDVITANAEEAARSLVALALGGRSEAVRFNAQKFVIEFARDVDKGIEGDPFNNLIEFLSTSSVDKEDVE